ncbi:MAG: LamG domain-containing protein [Planctomycetes bacterium]|nr:LamG domain-containing protein [Planctomycetota bacterium]
MNKPLVSLLALSCTVALPAQISPDFLVHHDFLPTAGPYANSGSTGVANDGTPLGTVNIVAGPTGTAVNLVGAMGNEVNCGPTPLLGGQQRTVSVWARTTATTGIVTPLAFGTNPGNGTKWDIDIDCVNGGVLELGISGGRTVGTGPALNDGQWHMLTTVLPAGATNLNQVRLFVDGAFLYSNSGNQIVNTTAGPVIVGRSANPLTQIQFFPGDVDEVVLWSVALTDTEVMGLHDVTVEPSLNYSANDYERLLEVYRQNQPNVVLGSLNWRRISGLTGPAGLSPLPGGGYQLVLDTVTGTGLATADASFVSSGAGCPSPVGVSTISAPQLPILGATLTVAMGNLSPTGLPLMVMGFTTVTPLPIFALGLTTDPTCILTVSPDAVVGPLPVVLSTASVSLPIPASGAFSGAQLFFQGTQLELTTGNWSLTAQGTATLGF